MLTLVGYKETREAREFFNKLSNLLGVSCKILFGTKEVEEDENIESFITFGKAARNRVKNNNLPILELEAASKIIKADNTEKLRIWNEIEVFVGTYISMSGKKLSLSSDTLDATFGDKSDVSWSELEMLIAICDLLGIEKGNLELIKEG